MKKNKFIFYTLLLLFVFITILVTKNYTKDLDIYFYNMITFNITPIKTSIYKVITILGSTEFIIALCILLLIIKRKYIGYLISASLIFSTIVNTIMKILIRRDRPEVIKMVSESTFSFPSGHAMASTMMYGLLSYVIYKSKIKKSVKLILMSLLYIIILLVCISRVYLGAHYLTDVIAGVIMSSMLIIIMVMFINKKKLL